MGWGPSPFGWMPSGINEEPGFRLEIVSLLAVIGEYAMAEQAQPLTASWLCLLPRLLPAPQVLLKPTRPFRMPDCKAKVVGVKGGTIMETLNYFPNIMHPLDKLKPLEFQTFRIRHKGDVGEGDEQQTSAGMRLMAHKGWENYDKDVEKDGQNRLFSPPMRTDTERRDKEPPRIPTNPGQQFEKPLVPAKRFSPLKVLDVASFLLTLILLFFSIWNRDGIACMALGTLSLISSIVGFASKWTPSLMNRSSIAQAPRGDVMIRTREGGYILVICKEEVARELYFGNEQCIYTVKRTPHYRILVGMATFLLMTSVVLLGNCKFIQQAAIGTAYILLNFCYWMVSLVPKSRLWDMSRYSCEKLDKDPDFLEFREKQEKMNKTATTDATPKTETWTLWLREAQRNAQKRNKEWDPVKALNKLLKGETPATQNPHLQSLQDRQTARDLERLEAQLNMQLQEVKELKRRMEGRS